MAPDLRKTPPVIYEIFPRSFNDSDGDGVGDLPGVIERLDHVRDLGVDAIWLAPFYPSPLHDCGYDVAHHRAVDPRLGSLDDFDAIVRAANDRGLGVIVDLVFNHTSDEHPRFEAALAGDDAAADWYVFRDPKPDGTAPNNWMSFFGTSGWTWSHTREQYYFHQFTRHQPSLNLRSDAVQEDLQKTIRFWKDRGVSGFRLDVVTAYLFDPKLRDNPPASPEVQAQVEDPACSPYTRQNHKYDLLPGDGAAYAGRLRDWAGDDMWLVGENNTGNCSLDIALQFSEPGRLDAVYTTDIVECATNPATYKRIFEAQKDSGWVSPWWFSSHDQARPASKKDEVPPARMARFLAAILCAMPGPLMLYQGEELGLPQPDLSKDEVTDPMDLAFWPHGFGREGARVPVPWIADAANYGFSDGKPWLPMRWDKNLAADRQADDPDSVLNFYRTMLRLRSDAGFATARVRDVDASDDYLRLSLETDTGRYLATYNFGQAPLRFGPDGAVVLATDPGDTRLPSYGGRIECLDKRSG